ncbi:trypsin-like serine peptidase [Prauserella aidingensis]|uniref:trypsin-like serine peptidase n=1 Tax=Prauserella aidingensis TaxID=387890 RepID=UPI0020A60D42|nr:peptidase [Prauserella aidingensis]
MVTSAAVVPAAAAPQEHDEPGDVAVHRMDADAADWTPQRMRAALPLDKVLSLSTGLASEVLGSLPDLLPGATSTGDEWTGGGAVTKTAGRVFFTMDGQDASCSGNVVESGNGSVVVTAGHCVKYQGGWHTDWVFVPGYDNGAAPHGEWAAEQTMTTPQWEADEDMNHDVGMAVVEEKNGRTVADTVGTQQIAFNGERGREMYSFGYPAAEPYDGSTLTYCNGGTFTDPLLTDDHGMNCDMTGGSSGGPWFSSFDPETGTGVQESVNSFGYTFLPNVMFGPYFGDEAKALYDKASAA